MSEEQVSALKRAMNELFEIAAALKTTNALRGRQLESALETVFSLSLTSVGAQLAAARASTWQQAIEVAAQHRPFVSVYNAPTGCEGCDWKPTAEESDYWDQWQAHIRALQPPAAPPQRCPTCDSPAPHLHPSIQHEGEVQPCKDAWHLQETSQIRPAVCSHERLDEDGICRSCGADKRGIGI